MHRAAVWTLTNQESRHLLLPVQPVAIYAADLTADGALAVVGDANGAIHMYHLPSGTQHVQTVHGAAVTAISFCLSGNLLATAGRDNCAKVWALPAVGQMANASQADGRHAPPPT
jgi:WD40 repeat protein